MRDRFWRKYTIQIQKKAKLSEIEILEKAKVSERFIVEKVKEIEQIFFV